MPLLYVWKDKLAYKYIDKVLYFSKLFFYMKKKCPICGKEKNFLEVHHLIPKRMRCKDKRLKGMRVSICRICHTKIHKGK